METLDLPQDPEMSFDPTPVNEGKPYFMGDHALIKFSNGGSAERGTYWLVDKNTNTIRPFESDLALDAVFGDELEQALSNMVVVNSPSINKEGDIMDGILSDFTILGPEYLIENDGSSKYLEFSSSQLKSRYGKDVDEEVENLASEVVDGFINLLKNNEDKTDISAEFLTKLKKDTKLMAFYISAMAYGDYTLNDIYSDIARRFHNSKE